VILFCSSFLSSTCKSTFGDLISIGNIFHIWDIYGEDVSSFCLKLQASFEDCSSLKRVQIPPWVTRIDDCAFEGTAIESVFVPRWAVLDHPFPAKTSIFISQAEKAWLG
jgi:hypothetical protein